MYLSKLNIIEHYFIVEKNDEETWLWHQNMCHQSAHTLHGIMKGNHAIRLCSSSNFEHKCSYCVARKHVRDPFPNEPEFRAQIPYNWSMPTFVDQSHYQQRKVLFANY